MGQPANQHQLAKVGLDHQRKYVPPVDAQTIHPLAHPELEQLADAMLIFRVPSEIVHD